MAKPKTPKSVSKAASVLASDNSSADAKSLAGSVLATSDDDLSAQPGDTVFAAPADDRVEEEPMVRFQDEAPFSVETSDPEPTEIVGEYSPDLADSETLDEFPEIEPAEVEEAVAPIAPKDIKEQVAAAVEAAGHVPVQPPQNRD